MYCSGLLQLRLEIQAGVLQNAAPVFFVNPSVAVWILNCDAPLVFLIIFDLFKNFTLCLGSVFCQSFNLVNVHFDGCTPLGARWPSPRVSEWCCVKHQETTTVYCQEAVEMGPKAAWETAVIKKGVVCVAITLCTPLVWDQLCVPPSRKMPLCIAVYWAVFVDVAFLRNRLSILKSVLESEIITFSLKTNTLTASPDANSLSPTDYF